MQPSQSAIGIATTSRDLARRLPLDGSRFWSTIWHSWALSAKLLHSSQTIIPAPTIKPLRRPPQQRTRPRQQRIKNILSISRAWQSLTRRPSNPVRPQQRLQAAPRPSRLPRAASFWRHSIPGPRCRWHGSCDLCRKSAAAGNRLKLPADRWQRQIVAELKRQGAVQATSTTPAGPWPIGCSDCR